MIVLYIGYLKRYDMYHDTNEPILDTYHDTYIIPHFTDHTKHAGVEPNIVTYYDKNHWNMLPN